MKNDFYDSSASLMIIEREKILTKFLKWISNLFRKNPTIPDSWTEENIQTAKPNITIPKAIQMPSRIANNGIVEKNSLEYLYNLSDEELNDLENEYDNQIQKTKTEIEKMNRMIEKYKDNIKKYRGI